MSFADFKQYFTRVQICKYHDDYSLKSFKLDCDSYKYHLIKLKINIDGEHTFSVSQREKRTQSRMIRYEYSNCRMILMGLKNNHDIRNGVDFIASTKGYKDRDAYLEVSNLKQGLYYLFVEMEWDATTPNGQQNSVSVTSYG